MCIYATVKNDIDFWMTFSNYIKINILFSFYENLTCKRFFFFDSLILKKNLNNIFLNKVKHDELILKVNKIKMSTTTKTSNDDNIN